mgnify:FL=1
MVRNETKILLMILNGTVPRLVGDILFRLDLFSKRMKREKTIITAKKMRMELLFIKISLLDSDRCG